ERYRPRDRWVHPTLHTTGTIPDWRAINLRHPGGEFNPKESSAMATAYIIYTGPHTLDLQPLQGKLVDVEDGGLQGLRTDQPGFQSMALALAEAMLQSGAAAGIPQDVYDHFVMCNET